MTTPVKPWESLPGVHSRLSDLSSSPSFQPTPLPERPPLTTSSITNLSSPPPLPPRPQTSGFGMTSSFGMPYNGYSSGLASYGGLGGLGGYGGYGGGYGGSYGGGYGGLGGGYGMFGNPYGYNRFGGGGMYGDAESRFIQIAEESSRPTFQSIESIVGAVGSVAMMLENTFMAMTSSFRAILGVAENFGRLRSLFAQFWSAFAIFRSINWLLKKLLVLMGIRTEDEFKAWARATAAQQRESQGQIPEGGRSASSWPALVFLGVIMTVPYIIMKLLGSLTSSIQANIMDPSTWKNPMKALAQYDFQATSPREISFRSQQMITIAPEALQGSFWNSGWLMATVDNKNVGLIPTNYVKVFRNQVPASMSSNMMISDKPISDISGQQINDVCPVNSVPEISIEKFNETPVIKTETEMLPPIHSEFVQPSVNFDECFEKAKEEL